jgi:integrase
LVPVWTPREACLLNFVVRRRGALVARFTSAADPQSADDLQQLLMDAVRRGGGKVEAITEYEMDVYLAGETDLMMRFVASRRPA